MFICQEKPSLRIQGTLITCFVTGRDGKSGGLRLQYAVNLRLALASRAIGVRYFQVQRFFGILGIGNFMDSKNSSIFK